MRLDNLTFWIFFGFWPVWLVWELILLYLRGKGMSVDLISMEAREQGYKLTVIPFVWSALAAHFWFNWEKPYSVPYYAIGFWLFVLFTAFLDYRFWNIPYSALTGWLRVYRWPGFQAALGLLMGFLLFPQKDVFKP